MKRALSLLLVLIMTFGLMPATFAKTGQTNGDSLTIVNSGGGPYIIVTEVTPENVSLKYGYHNLKSFESAPLRYEFSVDFRSGYGNLAHLVVLQRENLDPVRKKLNQTYSFTPRYDQPVGEYHVRFIVYCEDDSHKWYGLSFKLP